MKSYWAGLLKKHRLSWRKETDLVFCSSSWLWCTCDAKRYNSHLVSIWREPGPWMAEQYDLRAGFQCHWESAPTVQSSPGFLSFKATQAFTCLSHQELCFLLLGAQHILTDMLDSCYANGPLPLPFCPSWQSQKLFFSNYLCLFFSLFSFFLNTASSDSQQNLG